MKRMLLVCVMLLCLVPCAFAEEPVFAPQGEYRVFCENGLYGVQTLDGGTVIPARFSGICPIRGDLCVVEAFDGKKYGLWQLSTGEELLPCEYRCIEIAGSMVMTDSGWEPESDGYYLCQLYDPAKRTFIVTEDESFADVWPIAGGQFFQRSNVLDDTAIRLIYPDGSDVLNMSLRKAYALPSSNGIIVVYGAEGDPGWEWKDVCRYYNTVTGTWLDGTWIVGYEFANGYAAVWGADWKWYIMDETGAVVTPGYEWIGNEHNTLLYGYGLFSVQRTDGWYIIRISSETGPTDVLGPIDCIHVPDYLGGGMFALPTEEGTIVCAGLTGQQLMLPGALVYGDAESRRSMIIRVADKSGFFFADMTMIEPAYDRCEDFLGDYGFVQIDGLWYPIDRRGQVDRSVSYPNVRISYDEDCYWVEYDENDVLCLNPDLQPITHLSEVDHG